MAKQKPYKAVKYINNRNPLDLEVGLLNTMEKVKEYHSEGQIRNTEAAKKKSTKTKKTGSNWYSPQQNKSSTKKTLKMTTSRKRKTSDGKAPMSRTQSPPMPKRPKKR